MKKRFSVFFVFIIFMLTMTVLFGNGRVVSFADNVKKGSKSSILLDYDSKTVILSNNEEERLPIASMCKIMTLLLTFEAVDGGKINMDDKVVVSDNAESMGGSQVFLESGAEYPVRELIKSIVVASANDSCVALAERISGSEEDFVCKMNEKAKSLEMNNTNFVNATGLPKMGQYSCAMDVSKMFMELLSHKSYFEFSNIWLDKIEHPNGRFTEISNTNKLIKFYDGCDGGKTGYTSEAGHCLCATASKNGMRLISVVISAPSSKERFKEVSEMFNYGFNNFTTKLVVDNEKPLDVKANIVKGKTEKINVFAENPVYVFSKKDETVGVEIAFIPKEKICAPINVGDILGKIEVYQNGKLIKEVNAVSRENVDKKTYLDEIVGIKNNWALI